ncbi:hypothetical protein E4T50_11541 [Aureobasidium sp. EXF-12298]|jgi:hypothetical protein|nr:hypothetical protein E4T50_11541 [Aureobasidium sp. EXF-12298]KAI4755317.1 hypothetical protein E4T51_11586 [Aureobasidium sp. EXF-12344]KAI4770646.1 hypothetical protein E4T52_14346 [Aureobasidium sp. EXF-3400]
MPPQQAWASRQFQDCDSDGKSRAVQCKWCIEKKVAYNSTSRKTSHLKQCVAFNEHVVQLVEAENAGGYLCRELEQMPDVVLESVLDQTGSRRLQHAHAGQGAVGMGPVNGNLGVQASVLFGNANLGAPRLNPVSDTPRSERPTPSSALRAGANSISHASTPSTVPQRSANNFNRAQIDRAFASALNHPSTTSPALQAHQTPNQSAMQPPNGPDVSTLLSSFNSNTDPRISDALRLLDKDTRVRIARELLDEAYDGVKRAVDNYIEKQQYLNAILEDGADLGADEQGR